MAAKKKAASASNPTEEHVGTVEHYYPKPQAAAVRLDRDLKVGDTIHIQGHSDDYTEKVTSMQLDHQPIQAGHAGESVGVAVPVKVHERSEVLRVKAPPPAARKAAVASPRRSNRKPKRQMPARKAGPGTRKKAASPRKTARKKATARKAERARRAKPRSAPRVGAARRAKSKTRKVAARKSASRKVAARKSASRSAKRPGAATRRRAGKRPSGNRR